MAQFVKHEPCPRCGSRDNRGVWEDGHGYCFGCGKYFPGNFSGLLHSRQSSQGKDRLESKYTVCLPHDSTIYIPAIPLTWLKSYGITQQEIIANRILWSEYRQYLCFPYFSVDSHLEAWQGRYFGDNKEHPKWITYGKIQDHLHVFRLTEAEKNGIILCEDIISAIKIGRQYPSSPIFGSFVDWGILARYYKYTKKLTFWLDEDKYKASRKFESRASLLGFDARVIYTEKDPKEYSDEEIKSIYLTLNS